MNELIYGVWVSKNHDGTENSRYIFRNDKTFEFATKNGNEWVTSIKGTFNYEDQNLVLFYDDNQREELGYWGVNESELIQGFKCTGVNNGVEGSWILDTIQPFSGRYNGTLTIHYDLILKGGIMTADQKYSFNSFGNQSEFTGKYVVNDNEITISDSNADTPYFSNGTKIVCIIDNVLGLLNEITYPTYFLKS